MPRFDACPADSQKCVSTLNETGYPAFEPVPYTCSDAEVIEAIKAVVNGERRTAIVGEEPTYLETTFTSLVFRFTDTVQFELDTEAKLVHFRSDSVPYAGSDLGANRRRMERVSAALAGRLG